MDQPAILVLRYELKFTFHVLCQPTCPSVVRVPFSAGDCRYVLEHDRLVGEHKVLLTVRHRLKDAEDVGPCAELSEVGAEHHQQRLVLVAQILVTCQ